MAQYFVNQDELMKKGDFDKKLNVNGPLFTSVTSDDQVLGLFKPDDTNKGNFKAVRLGYVSSNTQIDADNGIGILFGMHGISALLNVDPFNAQAKIIVSTTDGKTIRWSDNLVFRSEINELKQEIATLKKQIGGVLTRVLSRLLSERKVVL